jgi:predicted nuclease of predicted toxin-antitoxin system
MKLLFDQNLSFELCRQLTDLDPGSTQARLVGLAEADDRAIWQHAGANGFVLVSLDADFAEMASLFGPPPKVIWLRCGNQPTSIIEALLRQHRNLIETFEQDASACLEIYGPEQTSE